MKKIEPFLTKVLILLVLFSHAGGEYPNMFSNIASAQELDATKKGIIIEEMTQLIEEKYVFPDVAEKIAEGIRNRYENAAYNPIATLPEFLEQLTKDLQSVNNDSHLGVIPRRGPVKQGVSPEEMYKAVFLKRGPFLNYGFKKVERLLGNIGCLVLDEFSYVEMDGKNIGGETARAAMQVLSNCDALIIDLRDNFGGREEMALLLLDYFFEEPVHLLNNRYRNREETEIWTPGEKTGGNLAKIPLYVLTSRHTVSGGEMFAYVLKNRKRATIIGEKTRGSAHRTHLFSLKSIKVDVAIPVGTTIDPETDTDWEGKGVEPDVDVPSGKAIDIAYKEALETILQSDKNASKRYEREWALMEADARLNPVSLDEASLQEFVGAFGPRKIFLENGVLMYHREGQPVYELEPMKKDLFSFVDNSMFYVRIKFGRNQSGAVDKMILVYDTGQKNEVPKK
ncbi:MAG: S41 family peptidase [Candidatus Aminicenantes bacterium]|nr:MAG: S41 family peptidase [Candidatus Aminicenantes bacterium]